MPDFPTRARFRAGIRAAVQRRCQREAREARLYGYTASVPASTVPPDLAEELDAVSQQLREQDAAAAPWLHQKLRRG